MVAKHRAAILHFILWVAIFRTVLNHWALLRQVDDKLPQHHVDGQVLHHDFFSSSRQHDYHRRNLQQQQLASTMSSSSFSSSNSSSMPARFIMGIFTIEDSKRLRNAVRQTIMWYNDSRVCSIGSVDGQDPEAIPDDCRLVYTFVMGANPNGSTQIYTDPSDGNNNNTLSLLTTPSQAMLSTKDDTMQDITFLNIKENMNDGKSPTWFHYASRLMDMYDIDYAIKCDMDTALRFDRFFEFANENLPRRGQYIYSGKAVYSKVTHHLYMEGQFYLMSRDLAQAVGSMALESIKSPVVHLEDADVGSMVSEASPYVHYVPVVPIEKHLPWRHQLKGVVYHEWFLRMESARLCGPNDKGIIAPRACYNTSSTSLSFDADLATRTE